jgi:hypothetical protein
MFINAMTFTSLLTQTHSLEKLRGLWIVMDVSILSDFMAKQEAYGLAFNRIEPVVGPASDPRYAVCADLVTEINGMHAHLFANLNQASFSAVSVVTRAELDAAGWFVSTTFAP